MSGTRYGVGNQMSVHHRSSGVRGNAVATAKLPAPPKPAPPRVTGNKVSPASSSSGVGTAAGDIRSVGPSVARGPDFRYGGPAVREDAHLPSGSASDDVSDVNTLRASRLSARMRWKPVQSGTVRMIVIR